MHKLRLRGANSTWSRWRHQLEERIEPFSPRLQSISAAPQPDLHKRARKPSSLSMNLDSKIMFCGDTHGPLSAIVQAARDFPAHHFIHLGDLSPIGASLDEAIPDSLKDRFWFIPGNHDYDHEEHYDQILGAELSTHNLSGKVVEIDGLRVAGLGGVFLEKIWYPKFGGEASKYRTRAKAFQHCGQGNRWRGGLPRKWRSAVFEEDVDALSMTSADILITHEAPTCHRYGFAALDELAESLGAKLVVHGHHHERYAGEIMGGKIKVMGVGYRGIANIGGLDVRVGLYDERSPMLEPSR